MGLGRGNFLQTEDRRGNHGELFHSGAMRMARPLNASILGELGRGDLLKETSKCLTTSSNPGTWHLEPEPDCLALETQILEALHLDGWQTGPPEAEERIDE